MKKLASRILVIIMMIGLLYIPENVYAASLSVSVSASTVKIGDTITVSVTVPGGYSSDIDMAYPSDLVSFESGSVTTSNNGAKIAFTVGSFGSTSTDPTTATFKFKAKSVGTVSFVADSTVAGDSEGNLVELGNGSASVSIVNEIYSDDNSLKMMYLSKGDIYPDFSPSTKSYSTTVDYSVTSVRVTATPNHAKASVVSVTGNENLQVGENTISVVVKAESGATTTYTIKVTRAEKPAGGTDDSQDTPSETQKPEDKIEGTDSGFDWGGKDLYFTEEAPDLNAIKDFKQDTVLVNNLNVPCYKHTKSNLVILNLKNDVDGGSLYVYDTAQKFIYPFIKLEANDIYVIALQPDETVEAPEGYVSCTLSIEGKGTITAYQHQARTISEFYLLYCVNNSGQYGWYQYDSIEGTIQRFSGQAPMTQSPSETPGEEDSQLPDTQVGGDALSNELEAQLRDEQNKNRMMICIFVFVVAVLLVVIFNLVLSRKKVNEDDEDFLDEEEGFEDEDSEDETNSDDETKKVALVSEALKKDVIVSAAESEEDDDEVEVEFYEMAKEMPVAEEIKKDDNKPVDSEDDFEFIDL